MRADVGLTSQWPCTVVAHSKRSPVWTWILSHGSVGTGRGRENDANVGRKGLLVGRSFSSCQRHRSVNPFGNLYMSHSLTVNSVVVLLPGTDCNRGLFVRAKQSLSVSSKTRVSKAETVLGVVGPKQSGRLTTPSETRKCENGLGLAQAGQRVWALGHLGLVMRPHTNVTALGVRS